MGVERFVGKGGGVGAPPHPILEKGEEYFCMQKGSFTKTIMEGKRERCGFADDVVFGIRGKKKGKEIGYPYY